MVNGTSSTTSDEVEGGLDRLLQDELLRLEQPATLLVQPIQRNCDDLIALDGAVLLKLVAATHE